MSCRGNDFLYIVLPATHPVGVMSALYVLYSDGGVWIVLCVGNECNCSVCGHCGVLVWL